MTAVPHTPYTASNIISTFILTMIFTQASTYSFYGAQTDQVPPIVISDFSTCEIFVLDIKNAKLSPHMTFLMSHNAQDSRATC